MFEERTDHRVACDKCGKPHGGWHPDRDKAEDAARRDYWQAYTDGRGKRRHRCPSHWSVRCVGCGRAIACVTHNVLSIDRWVVIDGRDALCPVCAAGTSRGEGA